MLCRASSSSLPHPSLVPWGIFVSTVSDFYLNHRAPQTVAAGAITPICDSDNCFGYKYTCWVSTIPLPEIKSSFFLLKLHAVTPTFPTIILKTLLPLERWSIELQTPQCLLSLLHGSFQLYPIVKAMGWA